MLAASGDVDDPERDSHLDRLVGRELVRVDVSHPGFDLALHLTGPYHRALLSHAIPCNSRKTRPTMVSMSIGGLMVSAFPMIGKSRTRHSSAKRVDQTCRRARLSKNRRRWRKRSSDMHAARCRLGLPTRSSSILVISKSIRQVIWLARSFSPSSAHGESTAPTGRPSVGKMKKRMSLTIRRCLYRRNRRGGRCCGDLAST